MALSKILKASIADNTIVDRPNSKPIIINGNMAVAQRGTSATGKTDGAYFTCDRMTCGIGNIGTYTITQESLTSGNAFNNGFANAWRIDCTTADASPAAGDFLWAEMNLEGQDLQLFKKGTSNAEKFTLAFWVKSNKTGTSQVNLRDRDNDRMCSGTYTISSADTWEHKVINIAADTTGAFDDDNGKSLTIEWWLGAGSTYSSGAVPTAWETRASGDRGVSTLAINDNTANDWAITGVQLEVGEFTSSTLPLFQHEDFGDNLARCQRYYQMLASGAVLTTNGGFNERIGVGSFHTNSSFFFVRDLPVPLRANPSLEKVTGTNYFNIEFNDGSDDCDDVAFRTSSPNIISLKSDVNVSGTAGNAGVITINNTAARVAVNSEL